MRAIYGVRVGADVALVADTAKTILAIRAGTAFSLDLLAFSVSLRASGASAPTNEPILVELCTCTFATNSTPGTGNTTETPEQIAGRVLAHGMTAFSASTSEPTVISPIDEFTLHGQQVIKEWFPLAQEPDCALNEGFLLRLTAPNAVDCRATMRVARN